MTNPVDIEILTVPTVGYNYKTVGLVTLVYTATNPYRTDSLTLHKAFDRLQHIAAQKEATAVIGLIMTTNIIRHSNGDVVTTILLCGTAIIKIE
jgi:uncharacterized protein YbjQ (UPF0145 family)